MISLIDYIFISVLIFHCVVATIALHIVGVDQFMDLICARLDLRGWSGDEISVDDLLSILLVLCCLHLLWPVAICYAWYCDVKRTSKKTQIRYRYR